MENEHEIIGYIKENPVAILSTTGEDHTPYGAAVFICAITADQFYFVTKTETQKFQNILANPHVAITIVNPANNSSLQATGRASVVEDASLIELIMSKMVKIYARSADWLPPLAKIRAGAYQVVGVKIDHARLAHYKGFHAGDKQIFKEL